VIYRRWTARAAPENVDAYVAFFRGTVEPTLAALPGFVDVTVLQRELPGVAAPQVEIVVVSRWTSMDAVRGFAGEDWSHAVVEPEAAALLLSYDRDVQHFSPLHQSAGERAR